MKLIATLIVPALIAAAATFAVVYSGVYNVGMANHDNALMNRLLKTAMTRSVQRHARAIAVPPLSDSAMIHSGFSHYDAMCVQCHGAPGVAHGEIAKGLWPEAPNLAKTAGQWTPAQLYWITKNGLKFSAMPAWGPSHPDKDLWAITAFVQKLPHLSPAQYQTMREAEVRADSAMRQGDSPPENTHEHTHRHDAESKPSGSESQRRGGAR
jgi:mono/diheme cytochrome c family protein